VRVRGACLAATLAACSTSPPPRVDVEGDIEIPATFAAAADQQDETTTTLEDGWWRAFGDPELDALVETALANNRDLRAAAARVEAAASSRTIAGSGLWPQAGLSLDGQRARRVFVGFPFGSGGVPSSTATSLGVSLNLSWELDVWGRIRAGEQAAIADLQATAADHAAARLSLVGQVCKAWFAATEARQQLRLATDTVAAFTQTAQDVRDRFRRGLRPAVDVHVALANLEEAEASVPHRRELFDAARRHLQLLAGRYPTAEIATSSTLPSSLPPLPNGLPAELLQRRPDLVAAERRLAAAGCRVQAARAALYPRISLTAAGGTTSEEFENLQDTDFRVWSLGANLLQPIFQGGALRADVAQNRARMTESLALYGSTLLTAFAEVENALAAGELLIERSASLAAAAAHSSRAYEQARDRWQRGLAEFLLVADGQRQSFRSESAHLASEREVLDNRVDLILALGGGFDAAAGAGENEDPRP